MVFPKRKEIRAIHVYLMTEGVMVVQKVLNQN